MRLQPACCVPDLPAADPPPGAPDLPAWPAAPRPAAPAWRDRLALLLDSTGEGMFGVDVEGRCMFMNRAAAQLLGHPVESVLGQDMHALIHHSHADGRHYAGVDCPIFNAFREGRPCHIEDEVLWRADGRCFPAEYSSHPICVEGPDGPEIHGAVVTFKDITARKQAEAQLRATTQALERANNALEARVAERTAELSRALRHLRDLAAHLETVRESERTRIAREVHDELGSLLVALKLDTGWLGKRLAEQAPLQAKCQGMGRLIDTAVDRVARIVTDLRPSILDHQGLWAALEWHAQDFLGSADLAVDLQVHVAAGVEPPGGSAGEGWAIAVFRIFQEMLSNVVRHAHARQVLIRLVVDGPPQPVLYLEVRDDGIGAPPQALEAARSYGVMGMRERARHFGGTLQVEGTPGVGTRVRLSMPLSLPTPGEAPSPSAAEGRP